LRSRRRTWRRTRMWMWMRSPRRARSRMALRRRSGTWSCPTWRTRMWHGTSRGLGRRTMRDTKVAMGTQMKWAAKVEIPLSLRTMLRRL
ncbi:hypothetical protein LTR95_017784, partial [Oleoguttula sp. CCFEE 5521]